MATPDDNRSKRGAVSVAVATIRDELQFMVRRMGTPFESHEASVKAQLNKVSRLTGLPPRRVKDFRHGYLNTIPAHQDRTIRNAYRKWLEDWKAKALSDLQQIETEHAELTRIAADYSGERWERARTGWPGARTLGRGQTS